MMKSNLSIAAVSVLVILISAARICAEPAPPVGQNAEEWKVSDWMGSDPLTLGKLRGKVVLVRWWTAPTCPYCKASAPALNEFHEKYRDDGLQVLGFYHHKSSRQLSTAKVREWARDLGFKFPVAIDRDWTTLNDWWLKYPGRRWTSVSFLIDRKGVIRYVHPGGQYVTGDAEYDEFHGKIQELLKEA